MAVQPELSILAEACLLKLYLLASEGRHAIGVEDLSALFEGKVKAPVTKLALELLIKGKRADSTKATFPPEYAINVLGYQSVEANLKEKSFLSIYSKKGDDWLFETGGIISEEIAAVNSIPATEDAWEPLPLDRQNPALTHAIEKIDELIQAIKQDNGYAANEPDERNFIVSALQAGVHALRDQTVIYRMQFRAFIWEPIKRITTRFGSSVIGVLADAAKEGLKEAFKHVAKKILDNL